MKKLLLLHNRHTPDDSDIWRVAIRNGWVTERLHAHNLSDCIEGFDLVRYYGNTLHAEQLISGLPFKFIEINPIYLTLLSEYTKRKIDLVNFHNINTIPTDCFIKPVYQKWFEAKIYKKGELIHGASMGDDKIYISEIVDFIDEVRCFVLNGEVLTSSLYRINKIVYQAVDWLVEEINFDKKIDNTPIRQYVKEICAKVDLPAGVVIDFGRLPNGEWALIEFNEAWASGLYYCDPEKCLKVIEASQK